MSNTVTIVGNVTRDPELRFTPSGQANVRFGHAVYLPAPGEKVQYTVSVSRDSAVWKTVCPVYPNQRLTLGSAAPAAISLQSLLESNPEGEAGKALLDAQAAHKPLLVNLWAPWCKPCRAEAPLLSAYARQCGESLSYVGLAMNSEYPASKKGAQDIKLTWPISIASQSQARLIDHALEGTPLPTTLLFDADGKLERAIVGKVSEASLQGLHACPDAGP